MFSTLTKKGGGYGDANRIRTLSDHRESIEDSDSVGKDLNSIDLYPRILLAPSFIEGPELTDL